jgi:hypothetical protein
MAQSNPVRQNFYMQMRVVAQGLTVFAMVGTLAIKPLFESAGKTESSANVNSTETSPHA